MCIINIKEILDLNRTFPEAGDVFYQRLREAMKAKEQVKVNMKDVTALPSMFLNVSLGRIIDEDGIDALKHNLVFTSITKLQAERLKDYFERYKE